MYADMDTKVRQADTKAQILLGINSILFASLNSLNIQGSGVRLLLTNNPLEQISIVLILLTSVALALSILFALIVTAPRFTNINTVNKSAVDNVLYFENIRLFSRDEYTVRFLNLSLEQINQLLVGEIHAQALIVAQKYRRTRLSVFCLFGGIVLWGLSRLLVAFV